MQVEWQFEEHVISQELVTTCPDPVCCLCGAALLKVCGDRAQTSDTNVQMCPQGGREGSVLCVLLCHCFANCVCTYCTLISVLWVCVLGQQCSCVSISKSSMIMTLIVITHWCK